MRKFIFILGIMLLLPLLNAVNLNSTTVLNTTVSNSSMTFSINITADSVEINPNSIYLTSVSYVQNGVSKTCTSINHSTENSNLDSADFPCTSSATSTTSSSSGGIPKYWKRTLSIREEEFIKGYTTLLEERWRCKEKIGDEFYYVGVVDLSKKTATINVSGNLQQKIMSIGEEWKVEVNNDKYYDIFIKLNSIKGNKANLTIKKIYEPILLKIIGDVDEGIEDKIKRIDKEVEGIRQQKKEQIQEKISLIDSKVLIAIIILIATCLYFIILKVLKRKRSKHK